MDRFASILAFVRTAERGNFASAGRSLGLDSSAVSKSVARLEAHLGVRLFRRTTRALTLTDEGRLYHQHCSRVLDDLDEADTAVSRRGSVLAGKLTASLPVSLGRIYIVPSLMRLFDDHPQVELTLELTDRHVDLIGEGYDAAVRIGELPNTSLVGRRLAVVRAIVCASEGYLAERGVPQKLDDLEKHRCVTFVGAPGARPSPWRFAQGATRPSFDIAVTGSLRVNNAEALVEAAIAGAGLVQLHEYLAAPAIAAGRLRPVLGDFVSNDGPPIHVLYPSARQLAPKTRVLVDALTALFLPKPIWLSSSRIAV